MSGIPNLNYPEFNRVADLLRNELDYYVLNPAEYSIPETTWEECLNIDLHLIRGTIELERLVMLPGWRKSRGARLEAYVASYLLIDLYEFNDIHYGDYKFKLVSIEGGKSCLSSGDLKILEKLNEAKELKFVPIGVTGMLHSGKDTLADFITKMNPQRYYKYSFASPMKKIAHEIFGFTEEQLYDPDMKERLDSFWGVTPRKFLQLLGTDMFRDIFRDDVWVKLAEKDIIKRVDELQNMIIADVRFNNEAEFIKEYNGLIIRVVRDMDDAQESRNHVSEEGIDEKYIDVTVVNNGSFEDLKFAALFIEAMLDVNAIRKPIILGDL